MQKGSLWQPLEWLRRLECSNMETQFIKVVHNGDMHSVGLYTGRSCIKTR